MSFIIFACSMIAIVLSVTKAKFPNLEEMANEEKLEWNLPRYPEEQKLQAVEVSQFFRSAVFRKIRPAYGYASLSITLVSVSVFLFAFWKIGLDVGFSNGYSYLVEKLSFVFRLSGFPQSTLTNDIGYLADKMVSYSFLASLGSMAFNTSRLLISLFISFSFPLRWWKWSRFDYYSYSTRTDLEKRKVLLLVNPDTPISPTSDPARPFWLPPIWKLYT